MDLMIFFRMAAIFLGLVFGFFAYRIFILTKGSSRGWAYFAGAGIILSAWAVIQTILIQYPFFVNIASLIGFTAIAILLPLGFIILDKNFGMNLSKFFSQKYALIIYGSLWVIFLIINFLITKPSSILPELAGIAHFLLAVMAIYALYPAIKMWKQTGRWFWLLIFVFIGLVGISLPMGAYAAGGCEKMDEPILKCQSFSTEYAEVIPLPYPPQVVSATSNYHAILLPGLILGGIGFFGVWKQLG